MKVAATSNCQLESWQRRDLSGHNNRIAERAAHVTGPCKGLPSAFDQALPCQPAAARCRACGTSLNK